LEDKLVTKESPMFNPLTDNRAMGCRLENGPLIKALGAVSFDPVLALGRKDSSLIALFQDKIRTTYPRLSDTTSREVEIEMNDAGVPDARVSENLIWHFNDVDDLWRVSVTSRSIALEVKSGNIARDALVDRLELVAAALRDTVPGLTFTRVGFRYLNRFSDDDYSRLDDYVRPELLGLYTSELRASAGLAMSIAHFNVPEGALIIKSGPLPIDEDEMGNSHTDSPRWYFDLDGGTVLGPDWNFSEFKKVSTNLTARICSFFKWAVTEKFLQDHS
jgi:uncharacterized protein (TIGR04255 family)